MEISIQMRPIVMPTVSRLMMLKSMTGLLMRGSSYRLNHVTFAQRASLIQVTLVLAMLVQEMGTKSGLTTSLSISLVFQLVFGMVGESSGVVSRNSVNIAQSSFGQRDFSDSGSDASSLYRNF